MLAEGIPAAGSTPESSGFGWPGEAADVAELARALDWGGEEGLVTELQAGSESAFAWLITHYHAPVYSLLFSMLGDAADAADVTQDVFLKAFRGIRSFRRGSALQTWLYRIAVREALNYRRWWWRHLRQQVSLDAQADDGRAALQLEDGGASPYEEFSSREVQHMVRGALATIPQVFRTAVILRDLEGLAYEEVAEVLEVSVGTVKSRILRGRQALREVLRPLLDGRRSAVHGRAAEQEGSGSRSMGLFPDFEQESAGGGGE